MGSSESKEDSTDRRRQSDSADFFWQYETQQQDNRPVQPQDQIDSKKESTDSKLFTFGTGLLVGAGIGYYMNGGGTDGPNKQKR